MLLVRQNLRLFGVFGSDELIDWMCPRCGGSFRKHEAFFLADPVHCPHCHGILDMTRFCEVIAAYEKDVLDNLIPAVPPQLGKTDAGFRSKRRFHNAKLTNSNGATIRFRYPCRYNGRSRGSKKQPL